MPDDPYLAGLTLLARRELSEAQLRQRLARRGHAPDTIDAAVTRLRADGSLDDGRVAGVIARTEVGRRRGRLRVIERIKAAGISSTVARRAADEALAGVDGDALLAAALDKRLRGREIIQDDREHQRLYRYLVGQGFDSDRVLALLRQRSRS